MGHVQRQVAPRRVRPGHDHPAELAVCGDVRRVPAGGTGTEEGAMGVIHFQAEY